MKFILEENGFDLSHEELSLCSSRKGKGRKKVYCLSDLIDRTINSLQPIIRDEKKALLPIRKNEEIVNADSITNQSLLVAPKITQIASYGDEVYFLLEPEVWAFNMNFKNYWHSAK